MFSVDQLTQFVLPATFWRRSRQVRYRNHEIIFSTSSEVPSDKGNLTQDDEKTDTWVDTMSVSHWSNDLINSYSGIHDTRNLCDSKILKNSIFGPTWSRKKSGGGVRTGWVAEHRVAELASPPSLSGRIGYAVPIYDLDPPNRCRGCIRYSFLLNIFLEPARPQGAV